MDLWQLLLHKTLMVGHGGNSAGSYLADPTSPIPSHCAVIILFKSVTVHQLSWLALKELKCGIHSLLIPISGIYQGYISVIRPSNQPCIGAYMGINCKVLWMYNGQIAWGTLEMIPQGPGTENIFMYTVLKVNCNYLQNWLNFKDFSSLIRTNTARLLLPGCYSIFCIDWRKLHKKQHVSAFFGKSVLKCHLT